MKVLSLGAGRFSRINIPEAEVVTLDRLPSVYPDILCTLGRDVIPLPDNSIDLAVGIHVLEHIGKVGETGEWFYFFEELYRVLKPDGLLEFESPLYSSVWAWGDPSHVRALSPQSFVFFSQDAYRIPDSAISPFRIKCDFASVGFQYVTVPELAEIEKYTNFRGQLRAIKPLRPWWEV